MVSRLPTTTMLEVFDAVMERGGFLKASRYLNMSAPAVSYTVKSLEQLLDIELFERRPDGIVPTRHAADLVGDARHIIERMRHMKERAHDLSRGDHRLRILTSQAFASLWLLPRMVDLIETFPGWHVEVISWTGGKVGQRDDRTADIDVEIRWIDENTEIGEDARFVAQDYALAVCSARYLQQIGGILCEQNAGAATAVNALNWPGTWQRWLVHTFGRDVALHDMIDLQTTSLCVQAAAGGVGIAMAHGPLIQRELAQGALVLANTTALPLRERYVAVRHRAASRNIFDEFALWVSQNMKTDAAVIECLPDDR